MLLNVWLFYNLSSYYNFFFIKRKNYLIHEDFYEEVLVHIKQMLHRNLAFLNELEWLELGNKIPLKFTTFHTIIVIIRFVSKTIMEK